MNGRWKAVAGVLGLIIAFGGAMAVAEEYRFWAKPSEVMAVDQKVLLLAGTTFETALRQRRDERLQINLEIAKCQDNEACPQSFYIQLLKDKDRIEAEIKKLEAQHKAMK